jgi:hypothetical protein
MPYLSLGILPREMKLHLYKDLNKHVPDSFIHDNPNWKQTKSLSAEHIGKLCLTHTRGYFQAITRNNLLAYTSSWMASKHYDLQRDPNTRV